jgi:CheY-like chemotaxis protein
MRLKSILIVEDDEMIRKNLRDLLISAGYSVWTARNGREGLDLIRLLRGNCIVLLDLQMPVMTGEQLLEALDKEPDLIYQNVPILIMTAKPQPVLKPVRKSIGKPINVKQLFSLIEKVFAVQVE